MSELPNNLRHLLGLHDLTAAKASELIGLSQQGLSQQALSELQAGRREDPRRQTIDKLAGFFEVTRWKLEDMPFQDLLPDELSDSERYMKVEPKIARTGPAAKA